MVEGGGSGRSITVLHVLAVAALFVVGVWPWLAGVATDNATFYTTLVASAMVSTILVTSLNMVMGYTGLLSLVHTGLLAIGGYATGFVTIRLELSAWLGLVLAVVLAVVFGVAVTLVSIRATYLYFGMITLAFNLVVIEAAREWESVTGGFFGLVGIPRPSVFGHQLTLTQFYYVIAVFAVGAWLYQRNLVASRTGRSWQAVRESNDAASALGIRAARTKVLAFGLSSALAGVAGFLFAHLNSFMNPDVALLDNGLVLFIGLLIGGVSTLNGPVLGVAFFAIVDHMIRDLGQYRRLILGVILIVTMVVIPRGIVGTWRVSRFGSRSVPNDDDAQIPDYESMPQGDEVIVGDDRASGDGRERETSRGGPGDAVTRGTEPSDIILSGRGIVKHFGGITALDGADVTIRRGEIHGIIGPNGSGKSTLIGCLTRFQDADRGTVEMFGSTAPAKPHEVAELGVVRVFQVPHLFEQVSVVDNVLAGMHMQSHQSWFGAALRLPGFRRDEQALRDRAGQLLAVADLQLLAQENASTLSHGQKRLLEVMRAVAAQPQVLILDEPATGLTGEEVLALVGLMRRLQDRGLTIAVVEHNLTFVMDVCDRITVLEQGRVIASDTPALVQASPDVQAAYLGPPEDETMGMGVTL